MQKDLMGIKAEYSIQNEAMLLQQAAHGSREAYAALYTFYLPKLYSYIHGMLHSKEDTQEILHDIFMKIWETKEKLLEIRSFNGYLYHLCRNRMLDLHEHRKVQQKAATYLAPRQEKFSSSPEDHYVYTQYTEILEKALRTLPPKRRLVFELSTLQELSHAEIAARLNISKSMVKKQLYAATRHVKEYLELYASLSALIATCVFNPLL